VTKSKNRGGRPPKTPTKQSARRAFLGEEDRRPNAGNSTMLNHEVRKISKFRAYARMVRLAEEIDEDLANARAASPRNPAAIYDLQDRVLDVLKRLLPMKNLA
jgi:hypothetical protein